MGILGGLRCFVLSRGATSRLLMRQVKVTGRFEELLHAVFAALYHGFPVACAGDIGPFLIRVSYLPLVRGFKRGFNQPLVNDMFLGFVLSI